MHLCFLCPMDALTNDCLLEVSGLAIREVYVRTDARSTRTRQLETLHAVLAFGFGSFQKLSRGSASVRIRH